MSTLSFFQSVLYIVGFYQEFRPSDPFIFEFLSGPWRNYTETTIIQKIYPLSIYGNVAFLIVFVLLSDLLRYKILFIIPSLCGVVTFSFLLGDNTYLNELKAFAVLTGVSRVTSIALIADLFAQTEAQHYRRATSIAMAAVLGGKALSGFLGQAIVSLNWLTHYQLIYISLAGSICTSVSSVLLLPVDDSVYQNDSPGFWKMVLSVARMKDNVCKSIADRHVIKWLVWCALSSAGFHQVNTYIQPYWRHSDVTAGSGLLEGLLGLVGMSAVLLPAIYKIDWKSSGDLVLASMSILQGLCLIFVAISTDSYSICAAYIAFGVVYYFTFTALIAEIASLIKVDTWGFIFGLSGFLAAIVNWMLTEMIVDNRIGLGFEPVRQFICYGAYHITVSALFIVIACTNQSID